MPGVSSTDADDWLERGVELRRQGRLADAEAALRRARDCAPGNARALSELAHVLRGQGRHDEAREVAMRATVLAPDHAGAWFNLGAAQENLGDLEQCVLSYRRALEIDPDFAEAWSNLGQALAAGGDLARGIAAYRRAIAANPRLAPVWSNLGSALLDANEPEEAITACRHAVALDPAFPGAWNNLANALLEQGEYEAAADACEHALRLAPELGEAWSNLGCALMEQGRLERSFAAHRRALGLLPASARAHYNLGLALERDRQHARAAERYRGAVDLDPDFAVAWTRLACVLLMVGEFAEGWAAYEQRWREKGAQPKRFALNPWSGKRTPGSTILLWGEQGIGDEILYAGMVGELAAAGMAVTLEIDPRLEKLMSRSLPAVTVVARADPPAVDSGAFDYQCALGSLGRWLRPSFDAFPERRAYLMADEDRTRRYGKRLRRAESDLLVGVSWRSANRESGAAKSAALAEWAGVLSSRGARFVDLQYGDTTRERESLASRHGIEVGHLDDLDLMNDLDGLAALCAACDLIITVSNVTAHLAGALGARVWLLAPAAKGRNWYWFQGRRDSPWYPSMRVFDQLEPGSWRATLDAVARELATFVAASHRTGAE